MSLPSLSALDALRDPATIRLRCAAITAAVDEGRSPWFRLDRARLDAAADRVAALTRRRFPDLQVPLHSRWRHFECGGVARQAELDGLLAGRSAHDVARAQIDLTVLSVLLDAGAGPAWHYREGSAADAPVFTRSEGLAVASFRAFVAGAFSATPGDPLRADAKALTRIDGAVLRDVFQVGADNPLIGLDGRAGLLQRLGAAFAQLSVVDGGAPRPGSLFDRLTDGGTRAEVSAADLLRALLAQLAPVWRNGPTISGQATGDVWMHRWAGNATAQGAHATSIDWVPFHKLSQWLAWSLVEPLQWSGVPVTGLDALTGLPEYRNGGLLIDSGVIVARDPRDLLRHW